MAPQMPGNSRNPRWDSEETISGLFSHVGGMKQENHLKLPQRRSRFPIIRPPEGCERMEPRDCKNLDYRGLPNTTSIRLLKIHPGLEDNSEESYSDFETFRPPVRCSLVVVDLNDDVLYDALSYTWGDPCTVYLSTQDISSQEAWAARAFDIEVDGKAVSVSSNLYAALLGLRSHLAHQKDPRFADAPQSSGLFWIDALCINQNDLEEKSSQVMMMSRIYHQARLVFAWLGGGDRLSAQAFYDLITIAQLCQGKKRDPKELRNFDILCDETYRKLGIPKLDYTSWIGVFLLFNRAWFKRAWIVQEIVLAREPWFMCGRQLANVETILSSFEILQRSRWFEQLRRIAEPLIQNYRMVTDYSSTLTSARSSLKLYRPRKTNLLDSAFGIILQDVRISLGTIDGLAKDGSSPKRPSLSRLLQWYRYTESGDARDKVYAFVSLSSEQQTRPLTVNYELDVVEVFIEVTRHLLDSSHNLKIFSLKKYPIDGAPTLELPSWVPDFTVQNPERLINEHKSFATSKGLGWIDPVYFSKSKLQLRGLELGKVTSIGVQFSWTAISEMSLLLQKVNAPEGQTPFETLWRTVLLDIFEETTPASMECGNSFLELLDRTVLDWQVTAAFRLLHAEYMPESLAKPQGLSNAIPEDLSERMDFEQARQQVGVTYTAFQRMIGRHTETDSIIFPPEFVDFEYRLAHSGDKTKEILIVQEFYDELMDKMDNAGTRDDVGFQILVRAMGRLLFVTERGDLGMGPTVLEAGDEVWILPGADVPLILRRSASSGEEYRLVGEAYVHGIMQGEAVAGVQEKDLKKVILV